MGEYNEYKNGKRVKTKKPPKNYILVHVHKNFDTYNIYAYTCMHLHLHNND